MEKIINGTSISPEENNALLEKGFLFRVKGSGQQGIRHIERTDTGMV